ncbi:MAG: hypothetical protein HQL05_09365 [Nitrospirae bacterium]|uniref:hypothetical protein n=1 Tax=Candidatus Magnetobacterium casense TaxID=1455061 RepID=UPI00058B475D|nr:hypothetical protein [Candidatus Magnetobacterium casensis]MBF0338031.1 hypothetical protein [Nitrospirota bacterium]
MQWQFTPYQVLNGDVPYGIQDYKNDLRAEIRGTLASLGMDEHTMDFYCDFVYMLFCWRATNQPIHTYKALLQEKLPDDSPVKASMTDDAFLYSLESDNMEFIDMLRVIITNITLKHIQTGLSIEDAARAVHNEIGFFRQL